MYYIPNALCFILENYKGFSLLEIKECFDEVQQKYVEDYFSFLIEKDLAVILTIDERHLFPNISMEWRSPLEITNAIIDVSKKTKTDSIKIIIEQLSVLKCHSLQIRFFEEVSFSLLFSILKFCENSSIRTISLLLRDSQLIKASDLNMLVQMHRKVQEIVIHSREAEGKYDLINKVSLVDRSICSSLCCGEIRQKYFASNIELFTESHHHNSCLNRKISIDAEGNIKNCPSMKESYGNIRDTTLMEALEKPGFKKYWNLTKDQVSVCKDCEFRYICTDCRAYLEDPEDIYSKPLKCGYNPYTCEWEEWSTNPLKQQAIDYYGMREILPEFARQKPSDAPSSDAP
jgi:SPASM domain peptide maturase of grasp-with-spasm system